jgi:hypothetical protein
MADSSWGRQSGLSDGEEEDKIDPGEEEVAERERERGEKRIRWGGCVQRYRCFYLQRFQQ